jgi:hypothetical protein
MIATSAKATSSESAGVVGGGTGASTELQSFLYSRVDIPLRSVRLTLVHLGHAVAKVGWTKAVAHV